MSDHFGFNNLTSEKSDHSIKQQSLKKFILDPSCDKETKTQILSDLSYSLEQLRISEVNLGDGEAVVEGAFSLPLKKLAKSFTKYVSVIGHLFLIGNKY